MGQCGITGKIGLSLEMWQLRFYTDDKASTNFKQLPSELPWIAFVLCLLQYQHDQKTFAKFCQKHNQENAFTILAPPRLDYIAGRSNKMCPRPGIALGLIIQNCHKAIATQKRMIYLPNFLSQALAPCCCRLLQCCSIQHLGLWSDIIIHHSRHQGIVFPAQVSLHYGKPSGTSILEVKISRFLGISGPLYQVWDRSWHLETWIYLQEMPL